MNTCDYGHTLIVYDCASCPLCDALETIACKEESINELQKEIDKIKAIYEPETLL